MDFESKSVRFSLKDIGSQLIDQLSTDIYSGAASILRELVKNAYDAYLGLEEAISSEGGAERRIVVTRERDKSGVGRLLVADTGVGQTLDELKANVQISVSRKQQELEGATGFRGLGSWAVLGAGSKIVITSSKRGSAHKYRLTIDVRQVYRTMGPAATLDDILNEPRCVHFEQGGERTSDHYTVVEIGCDGPTETITGYELNRLYPYTDPDDAALRELLIRSCPVPFASDSDLHQKIHGIYSEVGYYPVPLWLGRERLERRVPPELRAFDIERITLGAQPLAVAWYAEDPDSTGEMTAKIDSKAHCLCDPGIQLARLNVPIGRPNLFADNVRAGILNWYVGEVHIVAPGVLPDASGEGLRAGVAGEAFVDRIRQFYKQLEERAEDKSARISVKRHMQRGRQAAATLRENTRLREGEKQQYLAKIAKAVETIDALSSKRKPTSLQEKRVRKAARARDVVETKKEVAQELDKGGWVKRYSRNPQLGQGFAAPNKKSLVKSIASGDPSRGAIAVEELQARLGRAVPRLQEIGLSQDQIEQVLEIIRELLTD